MVKIIVIYKTNHYYFIGGIIMASPKQRIKCTVDTCMHNNNAKDCMLNSIKVGEVPGCVPSNPEESMCTDYERSF